MRITDRTPTTFIDLYELTMAQTYWSSDHTGSATFSLVFRKYPENRGYYLTAGLAAVLNFLESFEFADEDIIALDNLNQFNRKFLRFLSGVRFTGQVRAMPEGTICGEQTPVLEVTAPIIQAQIIETFLLNQFNLHSTLATKASRVIHVAKGKTIIDFGARRTQGINAAEAFARSSYLVGFAGTSNIHAGISYGIPVVGTMAHSFVQSYTTELESFRAYAESFPDKTTVLVDTYSTKNGLRNSIRLALEMKQRGQKLNAVRLDSDDLDHLSRQARKMLDNAGLEEVKIFASGGLDEYSVGELVSSGAPIDGFGVGTKVAVSADVPAMDSAYKLVAFEGRPVLKLSKGKQSLPGVKQVYRQADTQGMFRGDLVTQVDEVAPVGDRPLLEVVMQHGEKVRSDPSLCELRSRFREEFARLPEKYKSLTNPTHYPVSISRQLQELTNQVTKEIHAKEKLI